MYVYICIYIYRERERETERQREQSERDISIYSFIHNNTHNDIHDKDNRYSLQHFRAEAPRRFGGAPAEGFSWKAYCYHYHYYCITITITIATIIITTIITTPIAKHRGSLRPVHLLRAFLGVLESDFPGDSL